MAPPLKRAPSYGIEPNEQAPVENKFPNVHTVLLDIEGTTTPIEFVATTLFPYAAGSALPAFFGLTEENDEAAGTVAVNRELNDSKSYKSAPLELQEATIESLRALAREDQAKATTTTDNDGENDIVARLCGDDHYSVEDGATLLRRDCVAYVRRLIREDRKVAPLKALQGHLWRDGYESGVIAGKVYDDVPLALQRWHDSKIPVCIYSSGSIMAQKLLFGYSTAGNLLHFLSGHFDTVNAGPKQERASYDSIAASLNREVFGAGVKHPSRPQEILFVTDVFAEAVAAQEAGFQVALSVRPGNKPLPLLHGFLEIRSFENIHV